MTHEVTVIGAGLAGCELSWQLAERGIKVKLIEMRPVKNTPAHQTNDFAEMVCSNSFRNDDSSSSAVGLLHDEMRKLNSLILKIADKHKVPAGSALAVDRDNFSLEITNLLKNHENIQVELAEITKVPNINSDKITVIATGPLTSTPLSEDIKKITGEENFSFFDALAPIIYKESIDFDKAWYQSRYDKGDGKDYINCPMNKQEYAEFLEALKTANYMEFKDWEKDMVYFEGCLPIEVMASRGDQTLLFGPLKPKGLTNIHNPTEKATAVVQLRQDNAQGTLYNMVGFQTKMKHDDQVRVLRKIPGLENARFARLGGIHRNSFINSPKILHKDLSLKVSPNVYFAGQISGCEGYVESASMGLLCSLFIASKLLDKQDFKAPNTQTALGALFSHVVGNTETDNFQPMNVNFGLIEELPMPTKGKRPKGKNRKEAYSVRAKAVMDQWIQDNPWLKGS